MASFFSKVYPIVLQIPAGKVTTYGQIARWLDNPRLSRAVGYALNACHDPMVPCHRVVNRLGELSPAFMPEGTDTHRRLLEQEGVSFTESGKVDLARHMWTGPVIIK